MATIRLTQEEISAGLPPVCMCCGAAGEHRVPKTFLLRELNLGRGVQFAEVVAARAIHGLATAPRIRLLTSFCDAHRHYWRIRFALLFGGLIGLFALAIPGIIFAVIMITVVRTESRLPDALVFLTVAGYLAVWITACYLVTSRTIRVRSYIPGHIELQNVAEAYVAACEAHREAVKRLPPAQQVDATAVTVAKAIPVAGHVTDPAPPAPPGPPAGVDRPSAAAASRENRGSRPNVLLWTVILALVVGVPLVVCALGGVAAIVTTVFSLQARLGRQPADAAAKLAALDAVGAPKEDGALRAARTYLSDLKEIDPHVGYGQFGKNGRLGYGIGGVADSPITVAGRPFAKAISTAPPHHGAATVQYALGGRYREFRAWIAVNDLADGPREGPETPLTFKVLGDGKLLWESAPVTRVHAIQECRANVQNVQTLELQVHCPGIMHYARAVWLEPYLVQ